MDDPFDPELMEALAREGIEELHAFIDVESQVVKEKHNFHYKLEKWDHILMHIDEITPENVTSVHHVNGLLFDKILEMQELVASGESHELHFLEEEKSHLQLLEKDVEHREWRVVKKILVSESKEEKKIVQTEKHELHAWHKLFIEIMKIIKKNPLTATAETKQYVEKAEYYLSGFYRYAKAYERILRHMIRKERILARKMRRTARKIN